jgi:cob(I)alamin adenosyltransferase
LKQPSKLYTLVGEKNIQLLAEGIQLYGNKGNHATNRTPTSTVASKSDVNQVLAGIEKLQLKTEKLSSSVIRANEQGKAYQQTVAEEIRRLEREVKRNTQTHLGILGMLLNMLFGKKRYHR